ncbi:uncharacterized protein CC84DRAFT_1079410 [Paraphaeosphaeria sporulosa]|uniref:Xylanolytic transcriptional activator regulatory domain-containing protein n=1 Tax=Paraphaeosphaeria sporulosa TaxID=1460663 RepID=A0A177CVN3_9PLEO|nr:uncharacterized protein CC84DRAFT_1079410 [Paraphaeosphaeria sporulosa]OAG11281.1 hypothetical protein CC84DRAFT_1079410 [Paraphaeosphaeria sporulosa]
METYDREADSITEGDQRPSKRRRSTATTLHPPREVGLMRSIPGDKISSFVGSSSGVYFIRSVYSAFRSHLNATAPIPSPEVPGEDDNLPSASPNGSKRIWRGNEVAPHGSSTITFQKLVDWSQSYFANWHPAYPFLHAPAVLSFFESLSQGRDARESPTSDSEFIILRAIMSISLADRRQSSSDNEEPYPAELVFQSYDEASNSVQHAFSQPVSMQSLQAALSVQLFLVSMLRFNAASRLGGLIIRMALQMGLHRCPQRYPSFSPIQRELRHRVFFSLYCIDRFICQSTGLPLSLRDDDIDVCYPSLERHADGQASSVDGRLRLLEFLSRHCHIRGDIMEFKHKSIQHAQRETDQAMVITSKLVKLANDVDEFIDFDENHPPTLSPFHSTLLKILHHESVVSLNRPIIASNSSGSTYEAALQQCIGSARAIITSLHDAIATTPLREQASFTLFWPSFTWAVWMSTFILFHAAYTKHVSTAMVSRLADKSLRVLEHLARRGSVWPEACGAAIKDLQTRLTRNTSKRIWESGVIRPESSTPSPYDNATSVASPHVITSHTPTQTTIPTLSEPAQEHIVADATPTHRPGARVTATGRISRGSYDLDNISVPADTGSYVQTSDNNPNIVPLGDFSQNGLTLDQSFPFSSNDDHDPFAGFDIPFWLGQDQYAGMINEWS